MAAILDLRSHAFSTIGILGDFMYFHLGDVRKPSLKNSAFCIFFQVPSVLENGNKLAMGLVNFATEGA